MTEEIYRTALRQASATCRGSGQHWVADTLDELQREIDLIEVQRDSVAVVRKARELLARVANELSDPMGEQWCDHAVEDRRLLESLRDDVLAEIGGEDE